MKALKKTFMAVAATALLSLGTAAQAGVIIDLFTGAEQAVATSTLGATANNQSGVNPGVIGQYRDLSITKNFDNIAPVNSGESRLAAGGGALVLDNATGNKSVGVVTWDGINDAGANGASVDTTGLNVDLTADGANALLANIIAADLGFDYKIRVWDMLGNQSTLSASVQFAVQPGDDIAADYLFEWFNLATGDYNLGGLAFSIDRTAGEIDFTQIGALQLELSNASTISVDLAIGQIQAVPEPGTLALVGAALFGVAAVGRRRKA